MLNCPICRGAFSDAPELAGQVVACPHCRNAVQMPACEAVPLFVASPRRSYRKPRSEVAGLLAALLSFLLPGLGQLCQGRAGSGLTFLGACVACFVLAYPTMGLSLLLAIPVWLWSVVDAAM